MNVCDGVSAIECACRALPAHQRYTFVLQQKDLEGNPSPYFVLLSQHSHSTHCTLRKGVHVLPTHGTYKITQVPPTYTKAHIHTNRLCLSIYLCQRCRGYCRIPEPPAPVRRWPSARRICSVVVGAALSTPENSPALLAAGAACSGTGAASADHMHQDRVNSCTDI